MTIRSRLYTAIVVVVAALVVIVGVNARAMSRLGDRFDDVQQAADARALALQLKFDVTDFNGWQTAYGYDNGASRPIYLAALSRFQGNLTRARSQLVRPQEVRLLDDITAEAHAFARYDTAAWAALQSGRSAEVRRILLGPELRIFQRAAASAEALAGLEDARASAQERAFRDSRSDAQRMLIGASLIAGLLVIILLITAMDLVRRAERTLEESAGDASPEPDS
jgi:hypothetical protein